MLLIFRLQNNIIRLKRVAMRSQNKTNLEKKFSNFIEEIHNEIRHSLQQELIQKIKLQLKNQLKQELGQMIENNARNTVYQIQSQKITNPYTSGTPGFKSSLKKRTESETINPDDGPKKEIQEIQFYGKNQKRTKITLYKVCMLVMLILGVFYMVSPQQVSITPLDVISVEVSNYLDSMLINPSIVNYNSSSVKNFAIEGTRIKKTDSSEQWDQILSRKTIAQKNSTRFCIKATKRGAIALGIIDKKYIQDKCSWDRLQTIFYDGYGRLQESGNKIKNGLQSFAVNQTVIMTVSLERGAVSWEIDGIVEQEYKSILFADSTIQWVPFIMMYDQGDQIYWS